MNRHTELPANGWYLLQCKSRQDARAQQHLERQGFTCFAPKITSEAFSGGKILCREQLLFPGYLFIRISADDSWLSLRSTRGVNRIVAFGSQPCRVQHDVIDHLKKRCAVAGRNPALACGDKVQIKVGNYAEMDAIFLSMDGEERVLLLLNMLNRERQVQVHLAHIQAVQAKQVPLPSR